MLVPLYGFLQGDSIGLIVLVHDHQTIADAAAVLQQAASVRVPQKTDPKVYHEGRLLDPKRTISEAGLTPLERIDLVYESALRD